MSETRTKIQLHKKNNQTSLLIPITTGSCVELTDYSRDTNKTGSVNTNDNLNDALSKVENKLDGLSGKTTISDYGITDAYTKTQVDDKIASVYTVKGTCKIGTELDFPELPVLSKDLNTNAVTSLSGKTVNGEQLKVGYVFNIRNGFKIANGTVSGARQDFLEFYYDSSISKDIEAGANVVVVGLDVEDDTTHETTTYYFYDVLAMSVTSGGSGTVNSGTANKLAYYPSATTTVSAAVGLHYDSANKRLGIGNNITPSVTLHVGGDIYATGGITALYSSSDARLKENVKPFNAIDIVDKLKPVQFNWNDIAKGAFPEFGGETNYGLIAQDSEGIIDNLVFDMPTGYKGVRYEKLIPVLLQAIKELKNEIDILKNKE